MRRSSSGWWPGTAVPSVLAALTTWLALWSWTGFLEGPGRVLTPLLGGLLLVAGTGFVLRALRWPSVVVLLGQSAVLLVWITHRWAEAAAYAGWLPTLDSLDVLARRLGRAAVVAQDYSAPVPAEVLELDILLVLAGCGAGLLVDFLAVGLRRVPVAGLPLLAVYTAPVSVLAGGVPWWAFTAGALGFLLLLSHEHGERLTLWGRHVGPTGATFDSLGTTTGPRSVRMSARKIGLTATGLAVVVPLFVPTFGAALFRGGGSGGDGAGEAVSITNPLVDLRRDLVRGDDVDLLTVSTVSGDPAYLRTSVLDEFDGASWKPSGRDIPADQRADGPVPLPPGISTGLSRTMSDFRIVVDGPFASRWLPTPYPITSIEADGDWRYDIGTHDFISAAEGLDTQGMDYRLTALQLAPTAESLADAGSPPEDLLTQYTDLPDDLPDRVAEIASQVTAGAESDFDRAVLLQRWFREDGGFTYSLDRAPGSGSDELLTFLASANRVGYCEQFAASMAVMSRTLDIPARVSVGFLRPDRIDDRTFVYSAHDLHAWPELYFEGAGWLRFEPTPQARADEVPPYSTSAPGPTDPAEVPSSEVTQLGPDPRDRPTDRLDPGAIGSPGADGGAGGATGRLIPVLLVVLALLLTPRALRAIGRRRRWAAATTAAERAEVAWQELRATATDLGLAWDDGVTLRARARSLVASFGAPPDGAGPRRGAGADPRASASLERIVRAVERARYARPEAAGTAEQDGPDVRADVRACEAALHRGATPGRRRRATWLPASLVARRGATGAWRSPVLAEGALDRAR